jgi:hypothetical protein
MIKRLSYAFSLLIATDTFYVLLSSPILLRISQTVRISLLVWFILSIFKVSSRRIFEPPIIKGLIILIIVCLFYIPTDQILFEGIWMYFRMLFWVCGVLYFRVLFLKGLCDYRTFYNVFIRNSLRTAAIMTFLYIILGGFSRDYNILAYLLLLMAPHIVFMSNGLRTNYVDLLLLVLGIVVTVKRGAILGLFLVILFSVVFTINLRNLRGILSLLGVGLILSLTLVSITLQSSRLEDRVSSDQFDLSNESAGSGRVGMYTRLYMSTINSKYFLLGRGNQADSHRHGPNRRTHAHSDIFGFFYNYGLLGLTIVFALYMLLIRTYRKATNEMKLLFLLCLTALVPINLYSGTYFITDTIYLFLSASFYEKNL